MAGGSNASGAADELDWKFVQSFGDDNSSDDDLVTAVEFDETGQYLAVGDKAGRICIFEGHAVTASPNSNKKPIIPLEYKFYTEFQSHEPEFDCLKSLEIEEKINMIKWGKKINNGLFLLACNDKTIKYWKVHEKKIKRPSKVVEPTLNLPASTPTYLSTDVSIPKLTHHQTITTATPKRVYSNAHGYHINCFPEDDHQLLTQEGFMTLRQVEAHFDTHDTLAVACPREDGSMSFCEIDPSALLVHDGTHAHVEMVSAAKSASSTSSSALLGLSPTTNHRMWVSVAGKPFAMQTAGELSALAATASPALSTPLLAQFESSCPLGSSVSPAPLPFLHSLSLTTVDQSLAFLQLYGMSLQFAVRCDSALILVLQSPDQCRFLDSLLARLPLPLLSTSLAALAYKGQHGYCRYGLRSYAILSPAWIAAMHADATSPEFAAWVQPCSALELRCILHGLSGGQPLQSGSIIAASLPFRDQLTLACLRAGYTSTFTENAAVDAADQSWSVHYSLDAELTRPTLDCTSEMRVVHKTGRVWCVTVPTPEHRIMFRRVLRFGKDGCSVAEASRPVVVGNSISLNSDGETFISADDLRINLWNLQISNETFNVVDVKPPNLEELTEVITSATFHPHHCSQLIYSSSRGSIRLADLRDSALCDQHAKLFEVEEDPSQKSFFSEIISSISDAQFIGHEGRYILSRDYLTLKVWDVQMENRPVAVIPIHEYLKVHLCDLYENDCIFDKFESASSSDGSRYVTGSYNNHFVIHHVPSASNITVEALKDPPKRKPKPDPKLLMGGAGGKLTPKKADAPGANETTPDTPNVNLMDFGKKALHVSYHPSQHVIAIAGLNKLYIYQAINAAQN